MIITPYEWSCGPLLITADGEKNILVRIIYHLWPGENIQEITFKFLYLWEVLRSSPKSFNHAHHAMAPAISSCVRPRFEGLASDVQVPPVLAETKANRLTWTIKSLLVHDGNLITVYYTLPKTNMVPGAFAVSFKEGNPLKNLGFNPQCMQGQLVTAQMEEQRFKSSLIFNDLIQVLQVFHVYFRYGPTTNMCRALRRKTKQYHCYQEGPHPSSLHPQSFNMVHLKMSPWKKEFLLQTILFRFHVHLLIQY